MKTIRKTKKEWLDNRGRLLPMEQLKEVSQSWDEKTWNRFLDSTDGSIQNKNSVSISPPTFREYEFAWVFVESYY